MKKIFEKSLFALLGILGMVAGYFLWAYNPQLHPRQPTAQPKEPFTEPPSVDLNPGLTQPQLPDMVVIKAGTFFMGGNTQDPLAHSNERPRHKVSIENDFAIGRYEVTFGEYDVFARLTKRRLPPDHGWGRGRRPVIHVSWHDARDYALWLAINTGGKYRLPSEAEWEYAARAGSVTIYWWGDSVNPESRLAHCRNCTKQALRGTLPVGQFKANAFGLYDTAGNVTEWTKDCYKPDYSHAPINGQPILEDNCPLRSIRGGSWYNEFSTLRSSHRSGLPPDKDDNNGGGFRLARDLD